MAPKPTSWGPYRDEGEARRCLGAFATRVVGPGTGVIFCDGMGAAYLTRPFYDDDGSGLVLVVTTSAPGPAPPQPPSGGGPWQRIETFLHDALTRVGDAEIAGADARLAAGEQEVRLVKQGWSSLHDFVEGHKAVFDGISTVGDVFGVLAGVVAGIAFGAGMIGVLPFALAGIAGLASFALLTQDGQLFWAELHGDEAREKEIENSPEYRIITLVGPLLVLPDLIASGPRAVTSLSKTAVELDETVEGAARSKEELDSAEEGLSEYRKSHAGKLDRPNIKTRIQRRQARLKRLVRDLDAAKDRLLRAQFEFYGLRAVDLPAYGFAVYGSAMAGISPPYLATPAHWGTGSVPTRQPLVCTRASPLGHQDGDALLNPLHLLIPPGGADSSALAGHALNFQVAVSHNPAAAQR